MWRSLIAEDGEGRLSFALHFLSRKIISTAPKDEPSFFLSLGANPSFQTLGAIVIS